MIPSDYIDILITLLVIPNDYIDILITLLLSDHWWSGPAKNPGAILTRVRVPRAARDLSS